MAPRRGEAELVQDWLTALHSLGVVPLAYAGHSYITDRGGSQIDFLAVTAASAVSLDCRAHWTAFSDHAPLRLSPAHSSGRRDLPITPAMFQTAGTAALADLRRRLRALEGTFGLRRLVATPQLPAFCHPDRPGDCPRGLLPPLHEDCTSPDGCDASAQDAPAQGSAPPLMVAWTRPPGPSWTTPRGILGSRSLVNAPSTLPSRLGGGTTSGDLPRASVSSSGRRLATTSPRPSRVISSPGSPAAGSRQATMLAAQGRALAPCRATPRLGSRSGR